MCWEEMGPPRWSVLASRHGVRCQVAKCVIWHERLYAGLAFVAMGWQHPSRCSGVEVHHTKSILVSRFL